MTARELDKIEPKKQHEQIEQTFPIDLTTPTPQTLTLKCTMRGSDNNGFLGKNTK